MVFSEYNHFEVELIDEFSENVPPPAIALCTASPFDPAPKSNFKQDFIRFWAMGEGTTHYQPEIRVVITANYADCNENTVNRLIIV